jgi:hypothetical protein
MGQVGIKATLKPEVWGFSAIEVTLQLLWNNL